MSTFSFASFYAHWVTHIFPFLGSIVSLSCKYEKSPKDYPKPCNHFTIWSHSINGLRIWNWWPSLPVIPFGNLIGCPSRSKESNDLLCFIQLSLYDAIVPIFDNFLEFVSWHMYSLLPQRNLIMSSLGEYRRPLSFLKFKILKISSMDFKFLWLEFTNWKLRFSNHFVGMSTSRV